jgi:hypothetical protein
MALVGPRVGRGMGLRHEIEHYVAGAGDWVGCLSANHLLKRAWGAALAWAGACFEMRLQRARGASVGWRLRWRVQRKLRRR